MKKLNNLPDSQDKEFWEEAEVNVNENPTRVILCAIHRTPQWAEYVGYIDNKDGSFSCNVCAWGGMLPGYMRILDGRIIDFRKL